MAMNRRRFLELLGMTAASGAIAYSFPSVIVPRNLIVVPDDSAMIEFCRQQILAGGDWFMQNRPMGLAHFIRDGRVLVGWDTVTFKDVSREIVTPP